ncbi:hypothetical protein Vadar_031044 [Vaccinium darrowii]|uniref:Uncharacterized protein n=1 Tax=Vaccinium darrowii TaxID=229202 RepID=A0ACB7YZV7_9ERIC|nr:hypothetical protein Vadar_031044 [Vaccinium darrowii]
MYSAAKPPCNPSCVGGIWSSTSSPHWVLDLYPATPVIKQDLLVVVHLATPVSRHKMLGFWLQHQHQRDLCRSLVQESKVLAWVQHKSANQSASTSQPTITSPVPSTHSTDSGYFKCAW